MATHNKEKKSRRFRLAFIDDNTHQQLVTLHFTRTSFFITITTLLVILCAAVYSIIAFTPVRTFIPGYPDARSKRAAIQNAITIDSLERVIYKWEPVYSQSQYRTLHLRTSCYMCRIPSILHFLLLYMLLPLLRP